MQINYLSKGSKIKCLTLKIIRENPDKVKAALKTRNADYDSYIDEILEIDEKRRKLSTETDALKAEQNKDIKADSDYEEKR